MKIIYPIGTFTPSLSQKAGRDSILNWAKENKFIIAQMTKADHEKAMADCQIILNKIKKRYFFK